MDLDELHPVAAIPFDGPPQFPGDAPVLEWLPLSRLRINREYQREVGSKRSMAMMLRMITGFHWSKFKALSVQRIDDNLFEITDGQHSAIVLATLGVTDAPCLVTDSDGVEDRAAAFIGINDERMTVDQLPMFWAQVAAGDEVAGDIAELTARLGVTIPRSNKSQSQFKPGDCCAVKLLRTIHQRDGEAMLTRVLTIGERAALTPIGKPWLMALREICVEQEFNGLTDAMLIDTIAMRTAALLLDTAKARRVQTNNPLYRELALVLLAANTAARRAE